MVGKMSDQNHSNSGMTNNMKSISDQNEDEED